MRVNINHPSFLSFIDNVNSTLIAHAQIEDYFNLSLDKKMNTLYTVFKLVKSTVSLRARLSDDDLKEFINVLWKKNEEFENYEIAAVLKDIYANFPLINDFVKPKRKSSKTVKVDKTKNG